MKAVSPDPVPVPEPSAPSEEEKDEEMEPMEGVVDDIQSDSPSKKSEPIPKIVEGVAIDSEE